MTVSSAALSAAGASPTLILVLRQAYRILDVQLTLSGPAELLEPLDFAYRRFAVDGPQGCATTLDLDLPPDGRSLTVDGASVPLVPELDVRLQLYQQLQAALMDAIEAYAVLHAAALSDGHGGVLLLAAPSGHGKSSLTLELARRGHRFLSDDFAPLDLDRRLVQPFPRAVGVVPGAQSPVGEPFRAHARDSTVTLFGKQLIDVGEVLGEQSLAGEPLPLRHVILLASGAGGDPVFEGATLVGLCARSEHAAELDALFDGTPGVEVLGRCRRAHLCEWKLRLDHTLRPTAALAHVFDGDRTVLFEKSWESRPDFTVEPRAKRIGRREAAEHLGREMLNRRTGGRLLARYGGSVARLFIELAGALRHAACWSVRVGRARETADLIERLVTSGPRTDD